MQRLPWEEALLLWRDHPFQTIARVLAVRSFKCPLDAPEIGVSTEGWPSSDWPGVDSLDVGGRRVPPLGETLPRLVDLGHLRKLAKHCLE